MSRSGNCRSHTFNKLIIYLQFEMLVFLVMRKKFILVQFSLRPNFIRRVKNVHYRQCISFVATHPNFLPLVVYPFDG